MTAAAEIRQQEKTLDAHENRWHVYTTFGNASLWSAVGKNSMPPRCPKPCLPNDLFSRSG
jgi:hypothetical protein